MPERFPSPIRHALGATTSSCHVYEDASQSVLKQESVHGFALLNRTGSHTRCCKQLHRTPGQPTCSPRQPHWGSDQRFSAFCKESCQQLLATVVSRHLARLCGAFVRGSLKTVRKLQWKAGTLAKKIPNAQNISPLRHLTAEPPQAAGMCTVGIRRKLTLSKKPPLAPFYRCPCATAQSSTTIIHT